MVALGLSDTNIGLIISMSWGFQIIMALLSGVLTDKVGRRRTTLLFDILGWGLPALISALAQNVWYFLAAGIVNSVWRITLNAWTCLMVEDADPKQLVGMYTWIAIANQLVGLVAPLASVFIGMFSLVPTMRGLYAFAAVMFTLKAIITYTMTEETAQGTVRMHETRHQTLFGMLREYRSVLRDLVHTPQTLYTAGIMLVISISTLINGNFWAIILTQKLHIPAQNLAVFPFVRSGVTVSFFFVVMPRITSMHFKLPMMIGFLGYSVSQLLLITAPDQGYSFLVASVFLEACSFAAISPLMDQMIALTIEAKERARIQSLLYMGVILLTSPFGWIAGTLSSRNRNLPFLLNIVLFTLGALLVYRAGQVSQKRPAGEAATA